MRETFRCCRRTRRPAGGEPDPCGEAEAYASELTPGTAYQVLLFVKDADGTAKAVGASAAFTVTPALP